MEFSEIQVISDRIKKNVERVIIGKSNIIDMLITSMIAGGHVLLEDTPGTGKTMLAKSMAKSIDGRFNRIQFTPDLLPSDITGLNICLSKYRFFTIIYNYHFLTGSFMLS